MPTVYVGPEEGRAEWEAGQQVEQERESNHSHLYDDALAALEVNRQLGEQNQAIVDAARDIQADPAVQSYTRHAIDTPTSAADPVAALVQLTAAVNVLVAVVDDLLTGLKVVDRKAATVAGGVSILAEHDQVALTQRIALTRLVVGALDDTD